MGTTKLHFPIHYNGNYQIAFFYTLQWELPNCIFLCITMGTTKLHFSIHYNGNYQITFSYTFHWELPNCIFLYITLELPTKRQNIAFSYLTMGLAGVCHGMEIELSNVMKTKLSYSLFCFDALHPCQQCFSHVGKSSCLPWLN